MLLPGKGDNINAIVLIIPLLILRFGVLGLQNKEALRRAAYFAPMEGNEKIAWLLYQLSNVFLVLYPLMLKVQIAPPLFWIAVLIYGLGVVVIFISMVDFAKPGTGGINTDGIYRFSRNPMYVGYFLYFLGCVLLTRSPALFLGLLVFQVSVHWIIRAEERWCMGQFGDAYRRYMDKVRRYL